MARKTAIAAPAAPEPEEQGEKQKLTKDKKDKPAAAIEALAKSYGIDINAILEAKVAENINKVLNDSHLAEIVPAMQAKIDATDKKLSDLTQLLTSLAEKAQAAQEAAATKAPGGQGSDGMALLAALLKGGQGGGGDNFDNFMERMLKFQTLSAQMWQNPLSQAIQMITNMQKASYGIGLDTKQVITGTEAIFDKPAEPKPNT